MGFSGGLVVKESICNEGGTGDTVLIPALGRSLGEGKATHSSILAWKILWTEEPGRIQSKGSQKVGHEWATKHALMTHWTDDLFETSLLAQTVKNLPAMQETRVWSLGKEDPLRMWTRSLQRQRKIEVMDSRGGCGQNWCSRTSGTSG